MRLLKLQFSFAAVACEFAEALTGEGALSARLTSSPSLSSFWNRNTETPSLACLLFCVFPKRGVLICLLYWSGLQSRLSPKGEVQRVFSKSTVLTTILPGANHGSLEPSSVTINSLKAVQHPGGKN